MVQATSQSDGLVRPVIYATWREDKAPQKGYSRELISVDTPKEFIDNLGGQPGYSADCHTYLDYFERVVNSRGGDRFLGTRVRLADVDGKPAFGGYAWKTYEEVAHTAQKLARGINKLGLAVETEGDG
jgi:hypothetical protein